MKALAIVEALDIREQVAFGLVVGGVGPVMHQLGLQRVKEALHRRVVQRIGPPAHGRRDACCFQGCLVVAAGLLDATVGMLDQARARPLTLDGHHERRCRQLGVEMITQAPADDLAGVQVQDGRHVEPALAGCDVGQVCQSDLVWRCSRELPVEQVGGDREGVAAVGRLHAAALGDKAAYAVAAHQAFDAPAANLSSVCSQGSVHTRAEQPKVPGALAHGMAAEGCRNGLGC